MTCAVLVVALVVAVQVFALRPLRVSSESMSPTLCRGDGVLVDVWRPGITELRRGGLVVFRREDESEPMVKRVVGLPGDSVSIEDGLLRVNGRFVDEPYVDQLAIDALYYGPVDVRAGEVLVLGDDRAHSVDSRAFGPVTESQLVGRVVRRLHVGSC